MSVHEDDTADQLAIAAPPGQLPPFFKLPDFWIASPAGWFGVAEDKFLLHGTMSQQDYFALVTTVLPEASARRVAHILTAPSNSCYDDLKVTLLVAHQLTAFQKAKKLFSTEPLGDHRPSELLFEMLELVYPGEEWFLSIRHAVPMPTPCCLPAAHRGRPRGRPRSGQQG